MERFFGKEISSDEAERRKQEEHLLAEQQTTEPTKPFFSQEKLESEFPSLLPNTKQTQPNTPEQVKVSSVVFQEKGIFQPITTSSSPIKNDTNYQAKPYLPPTMSSPVVRDPLGMFSSPVTPSSNTTQLDYAPRLEVPPEKIFAGIKLEHSNWLIVPTELRTPIDIEYYRSNVPKLWSISSHVLYQAIPRDSNFYVFIRPPVEYGRVTRVSKMQQDFLGRTVEVRMQRELVFVLIPTGFKSSITAMQNGSDIILLFSRDDPDHILIESQ